MLKGTKKPLVEKKKEPLIELAMILIGKTGNGKSATGNSIVNRKVFATSEGSASKTKFPQRNACEFMGVQITVVDCPGLFDTDLNPTEGREIISAAIKNILLADVKGYNAFLYVFQFGSRFSREEIKSVEILKQILGDHFLRDYGIIVMTYGDMLKQTPHLTLSKFCEEQTGPFKEMLEECNNRRVIFDNLTKDENIKLEQRKRLVKLVKDLDNEKKRYTNSHIEHLNKYFESNTIVKLKNIIIKQSCMISRILELTTENQKNIDINEIAHKIDEIELDLKTIATPQESEMLRNICEMRTFVEEHMKINCGTKLFQAQRLRKLQSLCDEFQNLQISLDEKYHSCLTEFIDQSKEVLEAIAI